MKKLIALIFLSSVIQSTPAATVRVEKTGAPGTYLTITDGIDASINDDTISIGAGVYDESVHISKHLTLVGDGPQFVFIRGASTAGAIHRSEGDYRNLQLRGLTISNPFGRGIYGPGLHLDIRNCVIANCGSDGIYNTGYLYVRQCTLANNREFAIQNSASQSWFTRLVEGTIFYKNYDAGGQQDYVVGGSTRTVFGSMVVGKPLLHFDMVAEVSPGDPNFLNPTAGIYILKKPSPAINTGKTIAGVLDPDGTVPDIGAFGGPDAAAFWPYPQNGPVVTGMQVTSVVQQGAKLSIKATATTR